MPIILDERLQEGIINDVAYQLEVQQAMLVVADEIINFEADYEAKTVFQLVDGINRNGKLKQVYRDLRAQQS